MEETKNEALSLVDEGKFPEACVILKQLLASENLEIGINRDWILFNISSCLAKQGKFQEALQHLDQIDQQHSHDLCFNRALCYYWLSDYAKAFKLAGDLLDKIYMEYPELMGETGNKIETLEGSLLIQTLNLKSASVYQLHGCAESKKYLAKIPMKDISEFDCVSLHNSAVLDNNLDIAVDKLQYLLTLDRSFQVPNQTERNLILIYLDRGQNELAGTFFSNSTYKMTYHKMLEKDTQQLLEIIASSTDSNMELILKRLDRQLEQLVVLPERNKNRTELIEAIASYLISFCWSANDFASTGTVLSKVKGIFTEDDWLKNMAHTNFMMDTNYEQACQLYERLLPSGAPDKFDQGQESLLLVEPMILGNLCVSYVLTGQNGEAEALIREVEMAEQEVHQIATSHNSSSRFEGNGPNKLDEYVNYLFQQQNCSAKKTMTHSCVINMIIGTLYCIKNNYEFGLNRVFKSLEPVRDRLTAESWHQAKRCILSMLDCHCKQMISVHDSLFERLIDFLIQCEKYGLLVEIESGNGESTLERNSVSLEARYLRSLVLKIVHDC